MEASAGAQALLRRAAASDHPDGLCARVDEEAFERAEGNGSPVEAEALKRRDVEAWIPGIAARPAVMAMSWSIVVAVIAATALSWLPRSRVTDTVGSTVEIGGCAVAVAVSAWGILSEVRGWEGSDASRWLLKRRVKAFGRALDKRRREVCATLVVMTADAVITYDVHDGTVIEQTYLPSALHRLVTEPHGEHMALRLDGPHGTRRFEWLRCDAAFEAAVQRFALRLPKDALRREGLPSPEPA